MDGRRTLKSIKLQNFLTYGPKETVLELEPLNVLIGPNTAGKSNLVHAISLLSSLPSGLQTAVKQAGGFRDLVWKGPISGQRVALSAVVSDLGDSQSLEYAITLGASISSAGAAAAIEEECLTSLKDKRQENVVYSFKPPQKAKIRRYLPAGALRSKRKRETSPLPAGALDASETILSQIKDILQYPEITNLGKAFRSFAIYRTVDWLTSAAARLPQPTDIPALPLRNDASNLALAVAEIGNRPELFRRLILYLKKLNPDVEHITVKIEGGTAQMLFHETGLRHPVPATRLSDGTLTFLCLSTVLLDPTPGQLVCIEEPEIGLHPDILSVLADMLREASATRQLIITTHSDVLVSALSDCPEAIVTCERDANGTRLRRLVPDQLKNWLDEYRLGEIWRMGELGANRW